MYVDDIKLAGKKQNIDPMWKVLNKEVDLGEPTLSSIMYTWDGQGDGVPKHVPNRRRPTRKGPEPACVQTPSGIRGGTRREEGWINILPWYRLVGVAKTSSETQRKSRAARKGKWPPRGTGTTVLTYPGSAPRGTGKAGEIG